MRFFLACLISNSLDSFSKEVSIFFFETLPFTFVIKVFVLFETNETFVFVSPLT